MYEVDLPSVVASSTESVGALIVDEAYVQKNTKIKQINIEK